MLSHYVASFEKLGGLRAYPSTDAVANTFAISEPDEWGQVVKIDHEEILCNYRIKVVAELAPSFEALVQSTIDLANALRDNARPAVLWGCRRWFVT